MPGPIGIPELAMAMLADIDASVAPVDGDGVVMATLVAIDVSAVDGDGVVDTGAGWTSAVTMPAGEATPAA